MNAPIKPTDGNLSSPEPEQLDQNWYLDRARAKFGYRSDLKLANRWGISGAAMSRYRKHVRFFDLYVIRQIAADLALDAEVLTARVEIGRSSWKNRPMESRVYEYWKAILKNATPYTLSSAVIAAAATPTLQRGGAEILDLITASDSVSMLTVTLSSGLLQLLCIMLSRTRQSAPATELRRVALLSRILADVQRLAGLGLGTRLPDPTDYPNPCASALSRAGRCL